MKKTIALMICVAAGTVSSNANADLVLASTSFENEAVFAGVQYVDLGDAMVDHDLVNNVDEPVVDSTDMMDLFYDASYVNTRDSSGLTDGDFVGVTDFASTVGAYTDGLQGYQLSDTDGRMDLTFGAVDISGQAAVRFEMDYFVQETGWEDTDSIRVFLNVDGVETDLLNTAGSDIDDLMIEGSWLTFSETISGNSAFVVVQFDSNSSFESLYLDRVSFSAVPEPTAAGALALIAGFGMIRRRK